MLKQENEHREAYVNESLQKAIQKEQRETDIFIQQLKRDNPHTNTKSFNELKNWWKSEDYEERQKDKHEYMRQLTIKENRLIKLGNDKVQPYQLSPEEIKIRDKKERVEAERLKEEEFVSFQNNVIALIIVAIVGLTYWALFSIFI